jgi:S-formylglutathione hydrolase FrmB
MACGLQDGLILPNQILRDYFRKEGMDLTYEETDGLHDWDFWDTQILKVLNWLPLEIIKK